MNVRFTEFSGTAITPHVEGLARLRIAVFREFPYLYDGSEAYERKYLQSYIDSRHSLVVLAHDGDALIGATTGLPMSDESEEFPQPFSQAGYDISKIFYCGESVLDARYRGRGIYRHLFAAREQHARELGFALCAFCCVQRAPDHRLRPADYTPLDPVWRHFGYREHPELFTHYTWKDIDQSESSAKIMRFWTKPLTELAP
jgi:GNAT superfamily N-acetyltransferase